MPVLTQRGIAAALRRLPDDEIDIALRDRIFAAAWAPGTTHYAAGSASADRLAAAVGLDIRAIADSEDLKASMQRIFARRLNWLCVSGLPSRFPGWSARQRLSAGQVVAAVILLMSLALTAFITPLQVLYVAASLVISLFFLAVIALRILSALPWPKPRRSKPLSVLPVYTILVPLFRETRILRQLLGSLMAIDYPRHLLDIKLVVEKGDLEMRRVLGRVSLPDQFEIIVVPPVGPQTKPKALNYALAFARGELLTIYDAEDIPATDQLRRAAAAFAVAGPDTACLQAELTFYNPQENWLSRQFTAEYAWLFGRLLPSLAELGLPIPLGGTSNHFRIDILREVGAWDAHNVTEDADLGLRLARLGYSTGVLPSRTHEEANCHLGNWLYQRARWLKGWMQTWLVHMRSPLRLANDLGWSGFWAIQALLLGVIVSALLHPFFIGVTVWSIASGGFFPGEVSLPVMTITGISLAVLVAGYVSAIYAADLGLRQLGFRWWTFTLLTMPVYWLLISVASWMALWQLAYAPFHWNKTEHGISRLGPVGNLQRLAQK